MELTFLPWFIRRWLQGGGTYHHVVSRRGHSEAPPALLQVGPNRDRSGVRRQEIAFVHQLARIPDVCALVPRLKCANNTRELAVRISTVREVVLSLRRNGITITFIAGLPSRSIVLNHQWHERAIF